jgi:hypothetical protein
MPEKYEREIEEILAKSPKIPQHQNGSRSFFNTLIKYLNQSVRIRNFKVSPGRIMVVGLSLLLLALIIRTFAPTWTSFFAWTGLLLLIVGYFVFFLGSKNTTPEKRWRGRRIETKSRWTDKFKR